MQRPAMPLFVDVQDVILRMQLSKDLAGIEEVVSSGIQAAQLHVERVIDGKLRRQKQDCRFFIDSESFSGIAPGGLYRLEIPSGLVRQDVVQVVSYSNEGGPFMPHATIDPGLMKIDYPRGYLYLDAETYADSYVRIQCDTGFEDGTRVPDSTDIDEWQIDKQYAVDETAGYQGKMHRCIAVPPIGTPPSNAAYWKPDYVPMEPIPDPIYEAIMSLVPMVFNAQQTTNRSAQAKDQYKTLTDHANILLQPYMRTQGFTFRSI
jgi:hypothetical protein